MSCAVVSAAVVFDLEGDGVVGRAGGGGGWSEDEIADISDSLIVGDSASVAAAE